MEIYFKIGIVVFAMNLIYLILNDEETANWIGDMQENMCKDEFARFVVTEGLCIISIILPIFIWPVTLISRGYEIVCKFKKLSELTPYENNPRMNEDAAERQGKNRQTGCEKKDSISLKEKEEKK